MGWLANSGRPITLARLAGTSIEMVSITDGHLGSGWFCKVQVPIRSRPEGPKLRERPKHRYDQEQPSKKIIWTRRSVYRRRTTNS